MAHKTLIGGTAYKVSGGKTLVNGTAYKISNGKTLVNGTARSITFASSNAQISIVVNPVLAMSGLLKVCGTVTINGTQYSGNSQSTTLTVAKGTVITCGYGATATKASTTSVTAYVRVNGAIAAQTVSAATGSNNINNGTYDYVVKGNATIEITGEVVDSDRGYAANVIITEQ